MKTHMRTLSDVFPVRRPIGSGQDLHVVCFSGGESSARVAVSVFRKFGHEHLVLLNHNISSKVEDKDIKRFKRETAEFCGVSVTYANMDGWKERTQFDVVISANAFKTPRGDALCTSRMKTEPFRAWLKENVDPQTTIVYYGFDKEEPARIQRRAQIMGALGYRTDYPLAYWPSSLVCGRIKEATGIEPPVVYSVFKHANCVGCLKAGILHWYVVFCTRPDIWDEAKRAEQEIGYSILKTGTLESYQCKFAMLRDSGVPATEKGDAGQFWRRASVLLGILANQAENLPCECAL